MKRWLAAILLLPGASGAQDHLLASAEVIDVSGPASGHSLVLAWIHQAPNRGVLVAGASRFELDDTRWTLGRLEYSRPVSKRLRVGAALEAGPAKSADERFTYRKLRLGLEYELGPRFALAVADTYLDIQPSSGHLVAVDLSWRRTPRLHFKAGFSEGLGSRLDASTVAVRADYYRQAHFYLGAVEGRTSDPRLLNLAGGAGAGDYRQFYAGVNLPVGAATVSLTVDLIDAEAATRRALTVGLKLPLGRLRGQR